jgi:hypothetical protein
MPLPHRNRPNLCAGPAEISRAATAMRRCIIWARPLRMDHDMDEHQGWNAMGTTQSLVGRLEAGANRPALVTLEGVAQSLELRPEPRLGDID